jgi:pentapeptide MXKDX repeat protein
MFRRTLAGFAALTIAASFAGGALAQDKPMASTGAMAGAMKSDDHMKSDGMKSDSMKKPMKKKTMKKNAMMKDGAMAKDGAMSTDAMATKK